MSKFGGVPVQPQQPVQQQSKPQGSRFGGVAIDDQTQGEGGPERFAPLSPDPFEIGDIERQRREMIDRHNIASNPGLAPQSVAPMTAQPQGVAPDARKDFLQSWLGQTAQGALETVASIPGAPIDAAHGIANFTRRQHDMPEQGLDGTGFENWNGDAWRKYFLPGFDQQQESPVSEGGRVARKFGGFAAGGALAGPAGMLPAVTGTVGSEVGRAADQSAPQLTKGYGEFAGGIAGTLAGAPIGRGKALSGGRTEAEVLAAKTAAYDAAKKAGLVYTPRFVDRLGQTVSRDLAGHAFDEVMHPLVNRVLARITKRLESGENVTLEDVDNLRQLAGNAGESLLPKERMLAGKIIEHIDEAVNNPLQGEVLMGDPVAGAAAIKEARALNHRLMKMRRVSDAAANAEVAAETAHNGGNIDNTLRQHFKPMLKRGGRAGVNNRGWTADEKTAIRQVTRGGGITHQIARTLGRMSPERGGLMQAAWGSLGAGTGLATGGASLPLVAAAAGGTAIAKRIADAMTRSHVQDLLDTVSRGGKSHANLTVKRMVTRAAAPNANQSKPSGRMLTKP